MTEKTFMGIPVEGHIERPPNKTAQRPIEELQDLFKRVLAHEDIEGIRWEQYTPYFNDGEPCYFNTYDARFKVRGCDDEDDDWGDNFLSTDNPVLRGGRRSVYDYTTRSFTDVGPEYDRHHGYDDITALDRAITSGCYDDALLEMFGDHAQITVRRDKIEVDTYSHD